MPGVILVSRDALVNQRDKTLSTHRANILWGLNPIFKITKIL